MQGASPVQVTKRRSLGGTGALAYPDTEAMNELEVWQAILSLAQAASAKFGVQTSAHTPPITHHAPLSSRGDAPAGYRM